MVNAQETLSSSQAEQALSRCVVRSVKLLPIKILRANNKHHASIHSISEVRFGKGYLTDGDLKDVNARLFVAVNDGHVVGFACGAKTAFTSHLHTEGARVPRDVLHAEATASIGLIRTIAVSNTAAGRGVGDRLFCHCEDDLKKDGAQIIVVPAWDDGQNLNIGGILSSNGYTHFLTEEDYWKKDCDSKMFSCPSRTDECVCKVRWYKKTPAI